MHSNKGFTLSELIMSLVVMSLLATSVAGLSIALTDAYEHGKDFQQDMQCARNSIRYISQLIKQSNLICAADNDKLVVWVGDENDDKGINLSELRYIEYDSSVRQVVMHYIEFPNEFYKQYFDYTVTLDNAANLSYISGYITSSYWKASSILARNVELIEFTAAPQAPLSEVLKLKIGVSTGENPVVMRNYVSIRCDWTDKVGTVRGRWELSGE